jgi:hypothetical protein
LASSEREREREREREGEREIGKESPHPIITLACALSTM